MGAVRDGILELVVMVRRAFLRSIGAGMVFIATVILRTQAASGWAGVRDDIVADMVIVLVLMPVAVAFFLGVFERPMEVRIAIHRNMPDYLQLEKWPLVWRRWRMVGQVVMLVVVIAAAWQISSLEWGNVGILAVVVATSPLVERQYAKGMLAAAQV